MTIKNTAKIKEFISTLKALNIETINQCNYFKIHKACPAKIRYEHFGNQKLSLSAIKRLLVELSELNFQGRVGLHHYSEPLLDRRIVHIIQLTRKLLPKAKINIWSNGSLLTEELAVELMRNGVYWLRISAYSDEAFKRLSGLINRLKKAYPDAVYEVVRQKLDKRIAIYHSKQTKRVKSCWDMEDLLIINSKGDLQLCCMDYLCKYKFGNIHHNHLSEILINSNYLEMRGDIINGNRYKHDICSRCWS